MSMTDERVKKVRGVRAVEYHSAVKKKESLLFAVTWIELEGVMLSKIRGRQLSQDFSRMWNLKTKKMNIGEGKIK